MPVVDIENLAETPLFLQLCKGSGVATGSPLAGNVKQICTEASDRLKALASVHPQYTLHDERHSLRVVVLMGHVLGATLDGLNEIEIALLILSAYFHDQGMVLDADERERLLKSSEWRDHELTWSAEHPNRRELQQRLSDFLLADTERDRIVASLGELGRAMYSDYLRRDHGEASARYVRSSYGSDVRLRVGGSSIASLLASVCLSHVMPTQEITPERGYRHDALVGTTRVDLGLIAMVLRLADVLDFDRDRTPDTLYRTIDFSSKVSLAEWEKHRSITGWHIGSDRIAFAAQCEHPAYQRAVLAFLAEAENELAAVHDWGRNLPREFDSHRLDLPSRIDKTQVVPCTDPRTGRPIYDYVDLEFRLSRDEIIRLLMTDRLYNSRHLFVRELLQNALDALRHRQAIYQLKGAILPDLRVEFEHFLDESGFDVVRCRDNGVGMDARTVERYLTRVGRSYYRSPEFERERVAFRANGCDFDPCARFGIGFMSCFMFGDEIRILTKRENGEPLRIDITGVSGIVQIRPGEPAQPIGTTVEVRGRRKAFAVDQWDDPVRMIPVLEGYALATEFPIVAECRVPGIERRAEIAPDDRAHNDPLEDLEDVGTYVFVARLADADAQLRGEIRVCTLVDREGNVVVENEAASCGVETEGNLRFQVVRSAAGKTLRLDRPEVGRQVTCDGVLVAGVPGRDSRDHLLGAIFCNDGYGGASFLIDARGSLKPALTPARTPPNNSPFDRDPTWARLFQTAGRGYSRILDEIVNRCATSQSPERFWQVVEAYSLEVAHLRLDTFWRQLRVPFVDESSQVEWRTPADIGSLQLCHTKGIRLEDSDDTSDKYAITFPGNQRHEVPDCITRYGGGHNRVSTWLFHRLLLACSRIHPVSSEDFVATIQQPAADAVLADYFIREGIASTLWILNLDPEMRSVIRVCGSGGFANAEHPIVKQVTKKRGSKEEEDSPLDLLLMSLVWGTPSVPSDGAAKLGTWTHRWRTRVGRLYRAIDWEVVPFEMRPPFHFFIPGHGADSVTSEVMQKWGS